MKKLENIHFKTYQKNVVMLPIGGLYNIENLAKNINFKVTLIHLLQSSVGKNSYEMFKKYTKGINDLNPTNLRDLLEFRKINKPININNVEPIEKITPRFGSGSMSHGALSAEAHETLALE